MLGNKFILYISRGKIKVFKVSAGGSIKKGLQSSWKGTDLEGAIKLFKDKFKFSVVRVLLEDDLSYVMKIALPTKVEKANERKSVFEKFSALVPEELADGDWDYKVIGSNGPDMEVIAFAPVKNTYQQVIAALDNNHISVEAVEPVMISSIRNANPVVGIAMKRDLEGEDDEVLNLTHTAQDNEDSPTKTGNKARRKKPFLIFLIFLFILIAVGVVFAAKLKETSQNTVTPNTPAQTPGAETATPAPTARPREDYRVQVLNGSGIGGDAGIVQELLSEAGYTEIATGNAEVLDYDLTEVGVKEGTPEEEVTAIRAALSEVFELAENYLLTPDSGYDVVIITGSNKN